MPLKLIFALAVAFLLNKGIRGLPVYRALFYLPSLLGASVAIAVLWRQIFSADGLFNDFLALFGIKAERTSLEQIAEPLSQAEEDVAHPVPLTAQTGVAG